MFVVKYRKVWFGISIALLAVSVYSFFAYGFRLSTDFIGGSITEVKYIGDNPGKEIVQSEVRELGFGGVSVRPSAGDRYVIRTKSLNSEETKKLTESLTIQNEFKIEIVRSNTIGPVAGVELQSKALKAILVVILMIVLFVTFAFRGVSKPVSSWKYGFATIIALFHDVIIPTGLFVILGHLHGVEIDLLFVTGLLAILGYSVHDTIVVFDRVRENLRINGERNITEDFETTVGKSVSQTFTRSINTSVTIFITLLALYIFGSSATKDFSLLLLVGVIIGTYSSIFVASPLLVTFFKLQKVK